MTDTTQPSAGALRAAGGIAGHLADHGALCVGPNGQRHFAEIIDRETGHAEMAAALRRIRDREVRADRRKRGMVDYSEIEDLQRTARAALKAAGEGE